MGRGRAAGYNDQRELILAHAAHLLARRGYPSTSMNQVAEACGLSKATLYHYYRDKYSLLVSIAEGHVSRLQALVTEVEAEGLAPAFMDEATAEFGENGRHLIRYSGTENKIRVLVEHRELDEVRSWVARFSTAIHEEIG